GEHLERYDLRRFAALFLAGERLDPPTYEWARDVLGVPVVDHWWQTETVWPIVANCLGIEPLPPKPGSSTKPVPGWRVEIMDDKGQRPPVGGEGAVVLRLPLPPGALTTLWEDDSRFAESYLSRFEGCYLSGDGGYIDGDGYVFIMGRVDDVLNVAGHRLSTGAMEEVVAGHDLVAECAVIGVEDAVKGQVPVGFVVLKAGAEVDADQLHRELVQRVRDEVGPVASFKDIKIVKRLPKTRSGKILRRTMRDISDGRDYTVPSTIDDPSVLEELAAAVEELRTAPGGSSA
ncbi:MAG: AMP-binding protein, partial [Nitriliruptorales bacterium]|nr:AMP-binding protein [Nitriliruptorales bacterium]